MRWSLLIVGLEEDKQSTIALGYLVDREESGNVASKECSYEDLVVYYPIVAEEVQNMLKIFRETIGSNGNQIQELVGLLEVVGYKENLRIAACGTYLKFQD